MMWARICSGSMFGSDEQTEVDGHQEPVFHLALGARYVRAFDDGDG
jgi:hypothetical protein